MSNLWERAKEALGCATLAIETVERKRADLFGIAPSDLLTELRALLAEMERAGCVEGASARKYGPLGPGFMSGPPMDDERPALLILEGK